MKTRILMCTGLLILINYTVSQAQETFFNPDYALENPCLPYGTARQVSRS